MEAKALQIYPEVTYKRQLSNFRYRNYRKLVVPTHDGQRVISFDDILYIVSDSSYCTIVLQDQKITLSKTLKWVQERLDDTFIRVHNSYLVALLHIVSYSTKHCTIKLSSTAAIPVSRSNKQKLLTVLKA